MARAAGSEAAPAEPDLLAELRERVREYMLKAIREAKTRTSWVKPNPPYEDAVARFVDRALAAEQAESPEFLNDVRTLAARIARPGFWNSLARTLIEYTSPGTPDLYQGDELWNFSLVDPDNRRPVDYERRRQVVDELATAFETSLESRQQLVSEVVARPEDGRIKLLAIRASLAARRENAVLFAAGRYEPLEVEGARREHVFAFARTTSDPDAGSVRVTDAEAALVVVPRLTTSLVANPGDPPAGRAVWGDTVVRLPESLRGRSWTSALTWERLPVTADDSPDRVPVASILDPLPVGLLIANRSEQG